MLLDYLRLGRCIIHNKKGVYNNIPVYLSTCYFSKKKKKSTSFILFFKFVYYFCFWHPIELRIANMDCHYRELYIYIYIYSGLSLSEFKMEGIFFFHETNQYVYSGFEAIQSTS